MNPEPSNPEPLPLSLLNDYLYCPRRAALKIVEGWREANVHTERGDIVHEHSDLAGYEVVKGVTLLRALPVFSERLGLNGKCDIVELHPRPSDPPSPVGRERVAEGRVRDTGAGGEGVPFPVEFKIGKRRKWENDDAQLCAQALCLEEMFGVPVPRGAVFHADSKRRREVEFTAELRTRTETAARDLQALMGSDAIPPAEFRDACKECSLFAICLPKATGRESRAARLARELFSV